MSEPPTILIREIDDDKTLIDPIALSDPDPPFEGSGRALSTPARLHRRVRKASEVGTGPVGVLVIVLVIVLAVVMGLGSVAYHQWRAAAALRDVIAEMNARQDATRSRDFAASPGRASVPPGNKAAPGSKKVVKANDMPSVNRVVETQVKRG